jgi:hypothetical protein
MKKLLLTLALQMFFWAVVFGQTDDPGCNLSASITDSNCEATSTCATATNCPSTSFTVVCPNNTYWVKAYTKCDGTHCAHCKACLKITDSGGRTVVLFDTGNECNSNDCCEVQTWVPGSTGTFHIQVCLVPCNSVDGSVCCEEFSCNAIGIVSSNTLTCP